MKNQAKYIQQELSGLYTQSEISVLTRLLLAEISNASFAEISSDKSNHLSDTNRQKLEEMVRRLKNNEPIQYILGTTEFYGLPFRVTPDVLIPRPETEELVEWILSENQTNTPLSILDIGTGSGCIPIALAKKLPNARVFAWDISEKALSVAAKNAKQNNVTVHFEIQDVFVPILSGIQFDIIVSNPPYVLDTEKETMEANVLDYEPHIALFVPSHNPLLFYERIADIACKHLNANGKLYFEINREKGNAVAKLLHEKGFTDITRRTDMEGNERMIRGARKG